MPANTLNDMILGYAVILGILLIYVMTLIVRTHKAKMQRKNDLFSQDLVNAINVLEDK